MYREATRRQQCDSLSDGVVIEAPEALPRAFVASLDLLQGQAARRQERIDRRDEARSLSRCPRPRERRKLLGERLERSLLGPARALVQQVREQEVQKVLADLDLGDRFRAFRRATRDPAQHLPLDERVRQPCRRESFAIASGSAAGGRPLVQNGPQRLVLALQPLGVGGRRLATAVRVAGPEAVAVCPWASLRSSFPGALASWLRSGAARAVSDLSRRRRSSSAAHVDFSDSLEDLSAGLAMRALLARMSRLQRPVPRPVPNKCQCEAGVIPCLASGKRANSGPARVGGRKQVLRAGSGPIETGSRVLQRAQSVGSGAGTTGSSPSGSRTICRSRSTRASRSRRSSARDPAACCSDAGSSPGMALARISVRSGPGLTSMTRTFEVLRVSAA